MIEAAAWAGGVGSGISAVRARACLIQRVSAPKGLPRRMRSARAVNGTSSGWRRSNATWAAHW
jgi:hypothetical protein